MRLRSKRLAEKLVEAHHKGISQEEFLMKQMETTKRRKPATTMGKPAANVVREKPIDTTGMDPSVVRWMKTNEAEDDDEIQGDNQPLVRRPLKRTLIDTTSSDDKPLITAATRAMTVAEVRLQQLNHEDKKANEVIDISESSERPRKRKMGRKSKGKRAD